MRKLKFGIFAAMLATGVCLLSGCGQVDESILDNNADFSVNISVPFSTVAPATVEEEQQEQVVIDGNGKVTVNDTSLLNSSFTRPKETDESEYTPLSLGDTGFAVQTLQQRLKDLGYFTQGVSGIFDAETEAAVKRFEQTYGIMQTGIATSAFQNRLFSSLAPEYGSDQYEQAVVSQYTTLQRGATGSSVYALQHRLKELGYPVDELTGVYDEQTEDAVKLFYQAYGLQPQGAAYIALQKELYSENARPYSVDGEVQRTGEDDTTLSLGKVGTLVMQIQEKLIRLGYMGGTASGIFDAETETAVRLFEEACGFEVTGTLSYALQAILLSDEAPAYGSTYSASDVTYVDLTEGDTGDEVTALQNRLIALGYATGAGNGVYGPETTAAVRMFQRYNDLEQTGEATAYVQSRLYAPMAISYEDVLNGITASSMTMPAAAPTVVAPQDLSIPETLTLNASGEAVERLQGRLIALGYAASTSGAYDEETASAVREFQAAVGVSQTGEASAELQMYLYSNAAPKSGIRMYNSTQDYALLQQGDTGESVTRLQQRLWQLGYLLTENVQDSIGVYHDATRQAVVSAQAAMGYEEPDGVAGPEFQCFLFSQYGDYIKK